jgi:hypothetical protein
MDIDEKKMVVIKEMINCRSRFSTGEITMSVMIF